MRKKIILLFLCFSPIIYLYSGNLKVNINYLLFSIPDDTNYIEFQCLIFGNTLNYIVNEDNKHQGQINFEIILEPCDSTQLSIHKRYTFFSDSYSDSVLITKKNIYNLFRIPISNGEYTMKLIFSDVNNDVDTPLFYEGDVLIDFDREMINISDIQLISSLSFTEQKNKFIKHNIDFIPYFSTFYPEYINQIIFMGEIYHTDKGITQQDSFIYRCYISHFGTDIPISGTYIKQQICKKIDIHVLLHSFNIDSLPSGNYSLKIAIYTLTDSLMASKDLFFQRSNPSMDIETATINEKIPLDSLYLYLDYIYVIANNEEKDFIRQAKIHTYEELDGFFSVFWTKRNPENPLTAWYEFYKNVIIVNNSFSTLTIKGYKTDRGYVFLKYGPPNEIEQYPYTQQYYPYEIWYYYSTNNQYNINFIFYNRDLVTNFYQLIHSTAKDEIYDPRWKLKLKAKDSLPTSIEDTE